MIDPHRKYWNEQQHLLQTALLKGKDHQQAIDLFLSQHAMTHAGEVSTGLEKAPEFWSFEDDLWDGLTDSIARLVPQKSEHSVAWMTWHMARCEDITMNRLVADCPQVLTRENWLPRLRSSICDTGNALSIAQITAFSAGVDLSALRAYRAAVGRSTQQIMRELPAGIFKKKVDPARIEQVKAEGGVAAEAQWLLDYWSSRTIAGLMLMPPTRHNFVHLNEAQQIKNKFG